jgi:hypothetical protein
MTLRLPRATGIGGLAPIDRERLGAYVDPTWPARLAAAREELAAAEALRALADNGAGADLATARLQRAQTRAQALERWPDRLRDAARLELRTNR